MDFIKTVFIYPYPTNLAFLRLLNEFISKAKL